MSLKELLGEELYNQVIEKAGDNKVAIVSDGNWFPKDKFDAKNQEVKDLETELENRDTQLEDLKKADPEALQKTIDDLQETNENQKNEYEEKLQKQAFDHALDRAIAGVNPKTENSAKAIKALLDTEKIKLDGDKFLNLDNQLDALKESDAHLFKSEEQQEPPKPSFTTGTHTKGSGVLTKEQIMKEQNDTKRQQLIKENSHLFK